MEAKHTVSQARQSVYEIVTSRIIAELEAGVIPWRKPWQTEAPKNLSSGKAYRGVNVFLLGLRGFDSPWWMTYQQALNRGGHVRKGEKGTTVVFWKWNPREVEDAEGEKHKENAPILRYYTVFNVAQCEGIAAPAASRPPVNPIEAAEALTAGMPNAPQRTQADHAAYRPSTDTVLMPAMQSFESAESFYSILFHELTHATGHASRLARPHIMEVAYFGSEDYSREELVAEMGASMLCAVAGIDSRTVSNSAAYIQSWLRVLKGDSRLVVVAAAQAQKAADYILGKSAADAEAVSEAEAVRA
jgi:antirestriction protein ArdC